jgi:hypothetical protein
LGSISNTVSNHDRQAYNFTRKECNSKREVLTLSQKTDALLSQKLTQTNYNHLSIYYYYLIYLSVLFVKQSKAKTKAKANAIRFNSIQFDSIRFD